MRRATSILILAALAWPVGAAPRVVTRLRDLDDVTLSGTARGDVLYRGAARWNNLHAGAAGQLLQSGGAGADPSWTTITAYTDAQAQAASGWIRAAGVMQANTSGDRILLPYAPGASANYGLISVGSAPFDGAAAGFFTGSASGTHLAVNAASAFTGNLADLQQAGVTRFRLTAAGSLGLGATAPAQRLDIQDGNLRFSVLAAPATAPVAALAGLGAGNLSNGAYKYRVTFVTAAGQTTIGSSTSNTLTVVDASTNGQIALSSIPVDPAGVATSRKLFRTQANGATYTLVGTLANNTATTFTDNVADATIASAAAPAAINMATGWVFNGAARVLFASGNDVILGSGSGNSITRSGTQNTYVGALVGSSTTSGSSNSAFGNGPLNGVTTGSENVAGGVNSLVSVTTGNQNTAWGNQSGNNQTTASNTIKIGYRAGYTDNTNWSVYIGNADASTTGAPLIYGLQNTGQVAIGAATLNAAAKLQLDSTTLGFLPPRMTTAQRDAIASPPEGLMVYDLTTHKAAYYNGTTWVEP